MGGVLYFICYFSLFLFSFFNGLPPQEDAGGQLLFQERYLEALTYFTSKLKDAPSSIEAHLGLGEAQERLFRYREASKTYDTAILILNKRASIGSLSLEEKAQYTLLGDLRKDLKKYLHSFKMVEKIEEDYLTLLMKDSRAYLEAGWRSGAESTLRNALLLRPDLEEARTYLVEKRLFDVCGSLIAREEWGEKLPVNQHHVGWEVFGRTQWKGGKQTLKGIVRAPSHLVQDETVTGSFSFSVQAHLKNFEGYPHETVKGGIIFGYQDPKSFYLIELWKDSVRLIRFVGTTWIRLEKRKLDHQIPLDRWFHLQLIVLPDKRSIYVTIDNRIVFSTTLKSLPKQGRIGFRAESCIATFQAPTLRLLAGSSWSGLLPGLFSSPTQERFGENRQEMILPCFSPASEDGFLFLERGGDDSLSAAEASLVQGIGLYEKGILDKAKKSLERAQRLFWKGYKHSPTAQLYLARVEAEGGGKNAAHTRLLHLLDSHADSSKISMEAFEILAKVDPFPKELGKRRNAKKKLIKVLRTLRKQAQRAGHYILANQCETKLSALNPHDPSIRAFCKEGLKSWFSGTLESDFPPWNIHFKGDSLSGWLAQPMPWKLFKKEAQVSAKGAAYLTLAEDFAGEFAIQATLRFEEPGKEWGIGFVLGFKGLEEFYLVKWDKQLLRFFSFREEKWTLLFETPLEKDLVPGKNTRLNVLVQERRGRIVFMKEGEEVARWRGSGYSFKGRVGIFAEAAKLRLKKFASKRRP